jgi:murein DD-endopeptidase MepM/ murein hydrolase activator NlpD
MRIKKSVGKDGANHWIDVLEVQHLLNDNMLQLSGIDFLEMDGKNGSKTEAAIIAYQKQVMHFREPDGNVGPKGKTIKSLISTAMRDPFAGDFKCEDIATSSNLFPLFSPPEKDYKTGMRKFGSRRSKGKRLHAGCDLYAPKGTKIRAMRDGIVMRPVEYFYMGTSVLLIDHGDFVARYGEISHAAKGIQNGVEVNKGDVIAYIGELKFKSGNTMSMLHLELYRGNHSGPLTTAGNKFRRRGDLLDPTPILDAAAR